MPWRTLWRRLWRGLRGAGARPPALGPPPTIEAPPARHDTMGYLAQNARRAERLADRQAAIHRTVEQWERQP